ncbi:MAG: helix-turn-helix domain-containing protein [Clostridium sp.]|nr:helix-turn-helix domain-containing protein [Clostridium sp.]
MNGYSRKEKIRISVSNDTCEEEHNHEDFELIYILEGSMDVEVNKEKTHLNSDDVLVINSNMRHGYMASENILFLKLIIQYDLISNIFNSDDIIFWCDSTRDENVKFNELKLVLKKLLNRYLIRKGETADFGHISLCYRIMDILSVNFCIRNSDKRNLTEKDLHDERIRKINSYMHSNYNNEVSMKDLADKLYLSYGYLSRFFKKNFGMSFADYLSTIRLYHAVDELLYSNIPITKIAYDNGFASVTVFNKIFKKTYGQTPSVFRKKASNIKESEKLKETDSKLNKRLEQFIIDDNSNKDEIVQGRILNTECSALKISYINPVCNEIINIGSAEDLLRSEVQEHVILLKERLGFKYVRFWNIFSEQLLIDISNESKRYNFSRLDSILDFLVEHGIRPHIELGQKPKRVYRNIQTMIIGKELNPITIDHDKWNDIITTLMKHLINRYGKNEVDNWKFELWFDERYTNMENFIEEYFELFDITYSAIKKYSTKIEIGGCGIRADYITDLGVDFLRKWNMQNSKPDYISIIYYAYVRGEENNDKFEKRDTDDDGLLHWVKKAKQNMKQAGMDDTKLYVSEWNLTISDRNYINDTCFKGAYIIKNVLDVYGIVDELGYFIGSDRVSQYYDSTSILHGGTGLLTKDSIIKPAGFAFDFLNHLLPYCMEKDKNYIITTDNQKTYIIICHNQKRLNYNYYLAKEDQTEKEFTWKYFEDRDGIELNFKISDVENGFYRIKTYKVNEENGSVLNVWGEMEYDDDISNKDIKYFRRVCEPKIARQKVEVSNGEININTALLSNEIAMIKIEKFI